MAAPAADTTIALDDAGILSQVARADAAEIGGARYMRVQTSNASVRTLATRLATDHVANLRQVTDAAATLNVTLPAVDTATAAPAGLQGLSGAAADSAWVQQEIDDHTATIDKLQNTLLPAAAGTGVKALLQNTIPVLRAHLAAAQVAQKHVGH